MKGSHAMSFLQTEMPFCDYGRRTSPKRTGSVQTLGRNESAETSREMQTWRVRSSCLFTWKQQKQQQLLENDNNSSAVSRNSFSLPSWTGPFFSSSSHMRRNVKCCGVPAAPGFGPSCHGQCPQPNVHVVVLTPVVAAAAVFPPSSSSDPDCAVSPFGHERVNFPREVYYALSGAERATGLRTYGLCGGQSYTFV